MGWLRRIGEIFLGKKIDKTRIFPITTKILMVFAVFILISNLTTNYINITFNRAAMVKLMRELLIKDMKEIYTFANTQHEIYQFNKDLPGTLENFDKKLSRELKQEKSVVLGVKPDGTFLFQVSKLKKFEQFEDKEALAVFAENQKKEIREGFYPIRYNQQEYFAIYKYNPKWDVYLIRAEELGEFYAESRGIFRDISIIIIIVTLLSAALGIHLLRFILRYVKVITGGILKMVNSQQLEVIALDKAPNDDITFLGVAFNTLSSTINNLMGIFRKFTNQDIVNKAYKEREIRLEGSKRELTCLFTDIKKFTSMTETLGTDIITLLNLHYEKAIREILDHHGVIGSIIGDALLAVYGVLDEEKANKSLMAVLSAYKIQEVARHLRRKMRQKRTALEKEGLHLSVEEERIYEAVLIEVGVGIDGGMVFYGNIGSHARMTNTVIGDNVNSASRLEGLTRIYQVPVICSEYVKDDVEQNGAGHGITFLEIDQVQVKGKSEGKRIYWPILEQWINDDIASKLKFFSRGLQLYYEGHWQEAKNEFMLCDLPLVDVFLERIGNNRSPGGWSGIWTMTSK